MCKIKELEKVYTQLNQARTLAKLKANTLKGLISTLSEGQINRELEKSKNLKRNELHELLTNERSKRDNFS